jgi:zinc protease
MRLAWTPVRLTRGRLRPNFVVLLALAVLQCASPAHAGDPIAWPHSGSDLKPDPGIIFGALANGMRYELMKNAYPAGRVSLRLRMAVGARDELAQEAGFAHLVEHMAFRGSTHFDDGEIMKRLASFGVRTGSDANANTSAERTVFDIDLPSNQSDSIALALSILRDIADGLSIEPQAVDSERKVVLAEARLRDTPNVRVGQRRYEFLLGTIGRSEHPVIGTEQTITSATADELRSFYGRFYRPERATLIVVGDTDPRELAVAIDKAFQDWTGRGEAPAPHPGNARPFNAAEVQVEVDPRWGNHAGLGWIASHEGLPDNEARERNDLVLEVGIAVLNRRFDTVAQGSRPPFLDAGMNRYLWAGETYLTEITAQANGRGWREGLVAADSIRLGALSGGLSQQEVDAVTARIIARSQAAADTVAVRPSAGLAGGLLQDLDANRVSQDPARRLQRVLGVIKPLRAKTVDDALREEFRGREPAAWLLTTQPVGVAELRQAVGAAEATRPRVVQVPTITTWPYTAFGRPGRVVSRRYDTEVDATMLTFANGVRLNVKKTPFAKDQVGVNVSIGHGYGDLPLNRPTLGWAILNAFVRGGLQAIDYDTMESVLAGKRFGVGFLSSGSAFDLSGSTQASDLDTQLQVLAAYCIAPGLRRAVFEQSRNAFLELIPRWQSEPYQELLMSLEGLLHPDDRRLAPPSLEGVKSARLEDFRDMLHSELEYAPIEITIVGDVEVEAAIRSVANTFGSMKPRSPEKFPYVPQGPFARPSTTPLTLFHQGREDQGAAAIAWPTVDMLSDPRRFYALAMLAEIMNARVFERLRPALGTSYASAVDSWQSEVLPESGGAFVARADVSPDTSQLFFDEVLKVAADLRTATVSQDEFDRAQKPRIARLQASIPTNGFWAHWLDLSQRDPRRLDFSKNALTYLKGVTPRDVQAVAITYLRDEASWRVLYRSEHDRPDISPRQ